MRIGIANDLPSIAEALRRIVSARPNTRVAWVAKDGAEAVALCAKDTPDLILMDMIMPNVDGVEATRQIMRSTPCAILIATSSVGSNAQRVFEAMGHGALDAIDTPSMASTSRTGAAVLFAMIDRIEKVIAGRSGKYRTIAAASPTRAVAGGGSLIAIGSSAGGPAALAKVLGDLPADFPAAIVIVQHVDDRFATSMADWLNRSSPLPVRVAVEGDQPVPGSVLLAGTRDHLTFKSANRLGYTPVPTDYVYRPSVDVFFQSVVRFWRGPGTGVLLTGMGRDGALGLKALRDGGWHTIAQDRASSAVYGMPKAAAEIGAAVEILAIEKIADKLKQMFCSGRAVRVKP
ncbi:MAG: chemotaxis response regulator protein-glutamate methylesterase [Steroidobacteraceae bacterium]